ncbi:MAG: DUF167 domain-containing protein [Spirochaetaceae bacterium]|nr:DUF167 domain-containing protein [Spirochaetaceae bacterium]
MDKDFLETKDGLLLLSVKALPGASKTEFAGVQGGRLRVRIAAAPEDGKANERLAAFLAKTLGCSKKEIVLKSGEKSRLKTVSLPPRCLKKAAELAVITRSYSHDEESTNKRRSDIKLD